MHKSINTRALVLSGGGTAGGAWMLGIINALRNDGVDLGDADLIVGTSAGARTGAQLATGALDQGVAMYQRSEVPQLDAPVAFEEFAAAMMRVVADTPDRQEAARRIANLEPLGSRLVSADDRRRMVAAHLPADAWPEKPLAIVAVDAQSGLRVAFDAASGVGLLDAITASGALPGVFPLVTINGTRYADGGVHSPYNADLAAGHDVVTVLSPLAPNPNPPSTARRRDHRARPSHRAHDHSRRRIARRHRPQPALFRNRQSRTRRRRSPSRTRTRHRQRNLAFPPPPACMTMRTQTTLLSSPDSNCPHRRRHPTIVR